MQKRIPPKRNINKVDFYSIDSQMLLEAEQTHKVEILEVRSMQKPIYQELKQKKEL